MLVKKLLTELCMVRAANSRQVVGVQQAFNAEREERVDIPERSLGEMNDIRIARTRITKKKIQTVCRACLPQTWDRPLQ